MTELNWPSPVETPPRTADVSEGGAPRSKTAKPVFRDRPDARRTRLRLTAGRAALALGAVATGLLLYSSSGRMNGNNPASVTRALPAPSVVITNLPPPLNQPVGSSLIAAGQSAPSNVF